MKLLISVLLVVSPAFAQAKGGGGHSGGGMRGPVRVAPSRPVARPAPVPYPVYVGGYYTNPFYYGGGYATAPAPDYGYAYDPSQYSSPQYYSPQGQGIIVNPVQSGASRLYKRARS
jgi:hypothetical protein